jgi:DNA ligase (NAD+)
MPLTAIKEEMDALVAELNQHNYNYYVLAMPTIGDYEFDKKLKHLAELERANPDFADPNSPTQRVGGDITKNFITITPQIPNAYRWGIPTMSRISEISTNASAKQLATTSNMFVN